MARLFFAVLCPEPAATALGLVQARLRERMTGAKIAWSRPEQVHCTLKFLGDLAPERAEAAVRAGRTLAQTGHGFPLTLAGLGAFPDLQRPQTLWVGASRGSAELVRLASRLDTLLVAEGFEAERRPFVPHLTLGRVKSRGAVPVVASAMQAHSDEDALATWEVGGFALMQSVSTADGVRYTAVETFHWEAS